MKRIIRQLAKGIVKIRVIIPMPAYVALRKAYRRYKRPDDYLAAQAFTLAVVENIPLEPDQILYESFHGKSFNCSPAAICLHLLDDPAYAHLIHIWAINDPSVLPKSLTDHPNVTWVKRRTADYGHALATAGTLINNTTFEPFFARREGQVYANTWHGVPLKRMFRYEGNLLTRHSNSQRNFLQASHILMPNRYTADILLGSADVAQAVASRVSCIGAPRIDLTVAPDRNSLRAQLGIKEHVQVIMVAPTWRGTVLDRQDEMPQIDALLAQLNMLDPERYAIFVQMHDFVASPNTGARAVPEGVTTNQFLSVIDTLVTDYSSIMFDFFATGRQVILFAYDLEDYAKTRGLIADLATLPAPVCRDAGAVMEMVQTPQRSDTDPRYPAARDLYFPQDDGQACARAIKAIWAAPLSERTQTRPRILIFGGAWKNNGITSSAINILGALTAYDVDVYLVTNGGALDRVEEYGENFRRIHPNIFCLHRTGGIQTTADERVLLDAFYKSNQITEHETVLKNLFAREAWRLFGDMTFDAAIDFSGYARFWSMVIANTSAERHAIYQHNDMKSEADQKYEHLYGLFATYKYHDAVVSVSPQTCTLNKTSLLSYYKEPQAAVSARNMIAPDQIIQAAADPLPDDLPLPPGPVRFVSVGRMSDEKAQDRMIIAIATLRAQGHDVELVLIGDGMLRPTLETMARDLDIADHVIFAGHRTNPFAIVGRCDCFVLSSDYEGQPMVLLEALTLGLPIVATDIAGTRSVVDHTQSVLVDPSTDGVTQGMRQFLENTAPMPSFDTASYCDEVMHEFMEQVVGKTIGPRRG